MMIGNKVSDSESFPLRFARFIRLSHTIFALPFAFIAMLVAEEGWPPWGVFGWILWCMVSARTLAMLFNRIVDYDLDRENPRTSDRSRLISKPVARMCFIVFTAGFVLGAAQLNTLCAALSPVAVALICFYSMTKRFTSWCHAFLGLALSAAPMGAWAAVTGSLLDPEPYLLAMGVLLWVFGFDLIYSTLDIDFDKRFGLFSFPSRFGMEFSLKVSVLLHVLAMVCFSVFGWVADLGFAFTLAWLACLPILYLEHGWARSEDPDHIHQAFFKANAVVSILLLIGTALSFCIHEA